LGYTRGTEVTGILNWDKGILTASIELDMASAGLRLPGGRRRAEDILEEKYFNLLRPYLLSLQVNSSSTIYDLILRGELSVDEFNGLKSKIQKTPPSFNSGLTTMRGFYTINLDNICALLSGSQRTPNSVPRSFVQTAVRDYTGIIIIANTSLPMRGRNTSAILKPCFSPRIWDSEMTLIYDRNMTNLPSQRDFKPIVTYTDLNNITHNTPSGLGPDLIEIVGTNPMRIIARELFGINPTDPVIHRDDAMQILASENNRRLLRESRVVIVVDNSVLVLPFSDEMF
jgi:hypothetical protein